MSDNTVLNDRFYEFKDLIGAEKLKLSINKLMNSLRVSLETMGKALQEEDLVLIGKEAHKIKGSSGTYGLNSVSLLAEDLELSIKNNSNTSKQEVLIKIESFSNSVEEAKTFFEEMSW